MFERDRIQRLAASVRQSRIDDERDVVESSRAGQAILFGFVSKCGKYVPRGACQRVCDPQFSCAHPSLNNLTRRTMIMKEDVGTNWKSIPWDAVFEKKIVADRIFLRSALIRKDLLPCFAGDHMPVTYSSSEPHVTLNRNGLRYEDGWVVKPADSSNASGVYFAANETEAWDRALKESNRTWVVQSAVMSSHVDGHNFHVRSLLLIVGDLDGYVYDDCRVLVAPLKADVPDYHARITNRSFNKNHPAYNPDQHNLSLRDSSALPGDVLRQIRDITAALCAALADHGDACRQQDSSAPRLKRRFLALDNTWEIFGLDFMVDLQGRAVLLEGNPEPSMDMWRNTSKSRMLRGQCPIMHGVPRSDSALGFTQVYSKRLTRVLRAARAASTSLALSEGVCGSSTSNLSSLRPRAKNSSFPDSPTQEHTPRCDKEMSLHCRESHDAQFEELK